MKSFMLILSLSIITFYMFPQNALNFDGVDDKVVCGNNSAVQITGNQITLEAWIKPTSFSTNVWENNIINKETRVPEAGYMLRFGAGGKLNFNIGNGSWHEITSSTAVLTANVWQHVAGTYDGSYLRIFVNGVLIDSLALSISSISNAAANLAIGDYTGGGRNFAGSIDELRIWNVARTEAQINADMNSEICGGQSGLVAYYRFNSGVAGGNNAGINTAFELTQQTQTSSLNNFSLNVSTSNWVVGKTLNSAPIGGSDTIYDAFCEGSTYTFGNQQIDTAGTYQNTFYAANGCDSLVVLILTSNPSYLEHLYDTICQGDVYSFNGVNYNYSGVFDVNFQTVSGCDSIIKLHLHVKSNVNTSVTTAAQNELIAVENNADYQWVDCDDNYSHIAGAINQSFTPDQSGNYAVIISDGYCTDTSDCISVTISSIENNELNHIQIGPNPSKDQLIISNINEEVQVEIINLNSKVIFNKSGIKSDLIIDLKNYNKGIYIIRISNNKSEIIRKVIRI